MKLSYEHQLTPKAIWNIEQNKPSLIVDDLEPFGVPRKVTHKVLLARGVYKWLGVRRSLIKLKNFWKRDITNTITKIKICKILVTNNQFNKHKQIKYNMRLEYYRGYLKAKEECRKEVRALCHSERWQAPDFDKESNEVLKYLYKR